ncbi:Response regulator receiver domain-containing protein [Roseateles sp. YR242]|uniref:response regulator n=1 Tax=Roseateles sp. YR242 TaxID=1855305 RepID=UPI0008D1D26A|nr:response regulator [Roseateles sp. YR242]SEL17062.1 Response regulator receiver domain-containing protein [Roseateles sp. YR242]
MFTVVVLDDNAPIRELMAEWLTADGHRVVNARPLTAAEALDVHLVLLDLPMLRDGVSTLVARVRARYPRAAVMGLSAHSTVSLASGSPKARELGLDGLLAKPCVRAELLAAVDALPRH